MKVLLVDDHPFQIKLISTVMQGLGIVHITAASSSEEALSKLSGKHDFNLIVLDLHMPGADVFKFMERLGSLGYTGSLIIASGQDEEVMHAASLVAKLRRFTLLGTVTKPVGAAALSELISKISR